MDTLRIAIPSTLPGGLAAELGQHFGHCDLYTIVEVHEGSVAAVGTLENVPHQQGGCMAPVNHLALHGVNVLLAGGMGLRPLMGFRQVGIEVFHGGSEGTVGQALDNFLGGKLPKFSERNTCGGGQAS